MKRGRHGHARLIIRALGIGCAAQLRGGEGGVLGGVKLLILIGAVPVLLIRGGARHIQPGEQANAQRIAAHAQHGPVQGIAALAQRRAVQQHPAPAVAGGQQKPLALHKGKVDIPSAQSAQADIARAAAAQHALARQGIGAVVVDIAHLAHHARVGQLFQQLFALIMLMQKRRRAAPYQHGRQQHKPIARAQRQQLIRIVIHERAPSPLAEMLRNCVFSIAYRGEECKDFRRRENEVYSSCTGGSYFMAFPLYFSVTYFSITYPCMPLASISYQPFSWDRMVISVPVRHSATLALSPLGVLRTLTVVPPPVLPL